MWKYVPDSWTRKGKGSSSHEERAKAKVEASAAEAGESVVHDYNKFLSTLPADRRELSPIYVHGSGIHYSFDSERAFRYHVAPFTRMADSLPASQPAPLKFFSLATAPGANKPVQYLAAQGPERANKFNVEMGEELVAFNAALGEESVARGAWGALDWFGSTDGAASFDGTHGDYQVVMERAQIFLNLLDVLHAEIVADGGLVGEPAEVVA